MAREVSTYYFDWSSLRGIAVAQDEGEPKLLGSKSTLRDLIVRCSPGDTLIGETNFEAHDPAAHNAAIELAAGLGIRFIVIPTRGRRKVPWLVVRPPRGTRRVPKEGEVEAAQDFFARTGCKHHEHDDLNAVEAIRYQYSDNPHIGAAPRPYPAREYTPIEIFNRKRTAGLLTKDDAWVEGMLAWLPRYRHAFTEHGAHVKYLGEARGNPPKTDRGHRLVGWNLSLMLLITIAARECPTRNDFDRTFGQYAHGYPSIYRSTVKRRVESITKLYFKMSWGVDHFGEQAHPRRETIRLHERNMRRMLRLFYHLARQGLDDPETGQRQPAAQPLEQQGLSNPEMGQRDPAAHLIAQQGLRQPVTGQVHPAGQYSQEATP